MIPTTLPAPDPAASKHSARVGRAVAEAIAADQGFLPFDRYMELVLYAPGLGYYAAGATRFGPGGDFVTAPELSPVFGRCIAATVASVLAQCGGEGDVLELGAGSGRLACEVLPALAARGELPRRYEILEVSADLRERQAAAVASLPAALRRLVSWRDRLPGGLRGVILGNEVADALPVRRFRRRGDGVLELGVTSGADGALGWATRAADASLSTLVAGIEADLGCSLGEGYESEVCAVLPAFVASLADALAEGLILLVDYGCGRREYYDPARAGGTLACFYRHRIHADPFLMPGLQDLTAWVDFTQAAGAGVDCGLELVGYTTQAQYLLDAGFAAEVARLTDPLDGTARLNALSAAQMLVLPGEMGERFKCLALGRGLSSVAGFGGRDFSSRL
jgi:SAM-dependent MidA family methyltransferase